jgi:uncharacterized protein YbaR (Trm112 family)
MMARMSSDSKSPAARPLDPELVKILRCPLTRSPLRLEGDVLIAERGGLRYPVRDGIPVLLVEEAALPAGVASIDALKKQLGL